MSSNLQQQDRNVNETMKSIEIIEIIAIITIIEIIVNIISYLCDMFCKVLISASVFAGVM